MSKGKLDIPVKYRDIAIVLFFFMVLGLFFVFAVLLAPRPKPAEPKPTWLAGPVMKIERGEEQGHGTGFHIGGGRIVTANHVVEDHAKSQVDISVLDVLGNNYEASVMWQSTALDIAIIQAEGEHFDDVWEQAHLTCQDLALGEEGIAVGYPAFFELQHVPVVVSNAEVLSYKHSWIAYQTIVGSTTGGMSGGPVFFPGTKQVAGVFVSRYSPGGTPFKPGIDTEIAFMVPASAICER